MNEKFPTGSMAKIRSRRWVIEVRLDTDSHRGKRQILNMITGHRYTIASDNVLQVTAIPSEELRKKADQVKISVVSARPRWLQKNERSMMPLTPDEVILHTTLSATTKALKNVRARSSVRNPKLLDLVLTATSCLETCLNELESYKQLPHDA